MADAASTTTFTSPGLRRAKAMACAGVIGLDALLLVQMSHGPSSLTIGYMAAVGAFGLYMCVGLLRSFRAGIELTDDGVVARTSFSTKRFSWGELVEARSKDRAILGTGRALIPQMAPARDRVQVVPQLRLTSGRLVYLHGLQIKIESDEISNWLDDALHEINNRLEARRRALGSDPAPSTPS